MRKKGEPRDPMHNRRNTKGSDRSRSATSAEATWNRNEEPPNRRGRSIRRAAERKSKASKKKAEVEAKRELIDVLGTGLEVSE